MQTTTNAPASSAVTAIRVDLRGNGGTVYIRAGNRWQRYGSNSNVKWLAMEAADRFGVGQITYRQTITRVMWTNTKTGASWNSMAHSEITKY